MNRKSFWAALLALLVHAGLAFAQPSALLAWGVNADGQVLRWSGMAWAQIPAPPNMKQVAAGGDGSLWGINRVGNIFRQVAGQWQPVPGELTQISVATSQRVWGVNSNQEVYWWNGSAWRQAPGKLIHVSAARDGTVWGVFAGQVVRLNNGQWQAMQGVPGNNIEQLAVGNVDSIWGLTSIDQIVRWNGTRWDRVNGSLAGISVAADGSVWGADRGGTGFRFVSGQWQRLPGTVTQVSIASPSIADQAAAAPAPAGNVTPIIVQTGPTITATLAPSQLAAVTARPVASVFVTAGARGKSEALCGAGGGLCPSSMAVLVSAASNNGASGCPAGSFMDLGKSSCWSCPTGYSRSGAAVDSERACSKPVTNAGAGTLGPATYRGPLCPAGSFHDPIRGGECYSCPAGYRRSAAHIDAANACFIAANEDLKPATLLKKTVWPHECNTSGSFHDVRGPGCYSCPVGYARTGYAVDDSRACSALVAEKQARASPVQKAECRTGEFHDIKIPGTQDVWTGGGCYTCPTAWDRTVHPVTSDQACEKDGRFTWEAATRTKSLICDAGEHFDPINTSHSEIKAMIRDLVPANATPEEKERLTAEKDRMEKIDSRIGTCWTCPFGSIRTEQPAYNIKACTPPNIIWKSAAYDQAGLFGLPGGEEVALALISRRTPINLAADGLAPAMSKSVAEFRAEVWDEIGASPEQSGVLKAAVLTRLLEVAQNPGTATPNETLLLAGVTKEIRNFRIFMAQDALDAYDVWKNSSTYRASQAPAMRQQGWAVTEVPPDFEEMITQHMLGSMTAAGGLTALGAAAMSTDKVAKQITPYAFRTALDANKGASSAAGSLGSKAAANLGEKFAASLAGRIALKFISVSGPQIIIAAAVELLAIGIQREIDVANARPQLVVNLATARNREIDFARLQATPKGLLEIQSSWGMLMSGVNVPKAPVVFEKQATLAKAGS